MAFLVLPSMPRWGFMFPLGGMQRPGRAMPMTRLLRIAGGIVLEGNDLVQVLPELWPMLAFLAVAGTIALKRYRQTLD
jgi:ABC-2 type transport system permease protein